MATRKPCTETGCPYEKKQGNPKFCVWHWLLRQPISEQERWAGHRRKAGLEASGGMDRVRIPESEWPPGERWCSGCQGFVPLWYCRGSRCLAHESAASHAQHLRATYQLSAEDYAALYDWQGGRCYICRRQTKKRLAVDHDHATGKVRGLLCADSERGCNHAILGNITGIDMARRIVDYLDRPPLERLRAGEKGMRKTVTERRQEVNAEYQAALARHFPNGPAAQALAEQARQAPPEPPTAPQAPPPAQPDVWDPFSS